MFRERIRKATEVERRELGARQSRLAIPPVDKEMLSGILSEFEEKMANGTNPQKKHLLHQLVKKVLIHSRQTIEIWYMLPNARRFEDCNIWLPKCNSMRTRPGLVEPEVYFRVVHVAPVRHHGAPVAACREQRVDIALGPKGSFENGATSTLIRRVVTDQVVSAVPLHRDKPKTPKESKTPRGIELLRIR